MSVLTFLKRVWQFISIAGTLAWLTSLGLAGVVGAILADLLDLAQPWRSFFFVGTVLFVTAAALPFAQAGLVWLATVLPSEKPVTFRDLSAVSQQERRERARENFEREQREAIHEVITTLEHHQAVIRRSLRRNPEYQGAWGENRPLFAGEARYDSAVRATERAFQAIQFSPYDDALAAIEGALAQWNEQLERD